jgi:hypothetical protein
VTSSGSLQGGQFGDQNTQFNVFLGASAVAGTTGRAFVGRPPLRASAFQERAVARGVVAGLQEQRVFSCHVIVGDGGVGKTQIANAVFQAELDAGIEIAVWITASSRTAVVSAFGQAHSAVGYPIDSDDAEEIAQSFLRRLRLEDRRWIIVLDDVFDPDDLLGLWPPPAPSGRVVVTTRRRDSTITSRGDVLSPAGFTDEECLEYLSRRLGSGPPPETHERGELLALAEDLGRLPLALSLAAAFILDEGLSVTSYRMMLTDRSSPLSDWLDPSPSAADGYGRAITKTWALAAERADALSPVGVAGALLDLVAVLDPNGAGEKILMSSSASEYVRQRIGRPVSPTELRRGLRNLHRLSLITHDTHMQPPTVRMHALAQRATLEELSRADQRSAAETAAHALLETWPEQEADSESADALRRNAFAAISAPGSPTWGPAQVSLLMRTGRSLGEWGHERVATRMFQDLADTCSAADEDHPAILAFKRESAYWLGISGDEVSARTQLSVLVPLSEERFGVRHPETFSMRRAFVQWCAISGDVPSAEPMIANLLVEHMDVLGEDHPDTLEARRLVASALRQTGHPRQAFMELEAVLADRIRILGSAHLKTLQIRFGLAWWTVWIGDPAESVLEYESLVAQLTAMFGPSNFEVLSARNNLSLARGECGDPGGAVAELSSLASDMERSLGPAHHLTSMVRGNLGHWVGVAEDPEEAVRLLAQVVEDYAQASGRDGDPTLGQRGNLAHWMSEPGDHSAALEELDKIIDVADRRLGAASLQSLDARRTRAQVVGKSGEPATAASLLVELASEMTSAIGHQHLSVLSARAELAEWLARAGELAKAVEINRDLLHDQLEAMFPEHRAVAATRERLAELSTSQLDHVRDSREP